MVKTEYARHYSTYALTWGSVNPFAQENPAIFPIGQLKEGIP